MIIDKMNISKKMILVFIILLVISIGSFMFFPKEKSLLNADVRLRIGVGDDITGLLLQYILENSKGTLEEDFIIFKEDDGLIQSFEFKDC